MECWLHSVPYDGELFFVGQLLVLRPFGHTLDGVLSYLVLFCFVLLCPDVSCLSCLVLPKPLMLTLTLILTLTLT